LLSLIALASANLFAFCASAAFILATLIEAAEITGLESLEVFYEALIVVDF